MKLQHKPKLKPCSIAQEHAEALFFGEKTGHVGYLQYGSPLFQGDDVRGADLWTQCRLHEDYYLAREDDALLEKVIKDISGLDINVDSVVDLGPGDRNALLAKTAPLIDKLDSKKYIAIDMATSYARDAAEFVSQHCGIKGQANVSNFLEECLNIKEEKALLFMGGSTISNIPVDIDVKDATLHLSAQLAKFRSCVDDQSYMLIGFDSNQDQSSLDASYQTDVHARLIEDIMWRMARDTDAEFNPECFQYQGKWMPKEHRYAHNVFVKKACVIRSGENETFLDRGQVLHLDNSYKFPAEMLAKAALNADWEVVQAWTSTGRAQYTLLKAGRLLEAGKVRS